MFLAFVVLLLLAGAYFAGRLLWLLVKGSWVVSKATGRARAELGRELAALTTEDLRTRLVHDAYFTDDLRRQPAIQQFLARIARNDEVALAVEYRRGKLYRMLASAEGAAGRTGRPEAVDAIETVSTMLQELARRTAAKQ